MIYDLNNIENKSVIHMMEATIQCFYVNQDSILSSCTKHDALVVLCRMYQQGIFLFMKTLKINNVQI